MWINLGFKLGWQHVRFEQLANSFRDLHLQRMKEVYVNNKDKKHKTPQGTIAIMVIFVITIIALWGSAYLTLLSRGLTVVP